MNKLQKVTIIGGGPAGLFSAYILLKKGFQVDLYDHSSGLGKKFLIAGNGGLNLTHSENIEDFASRYEEHSDFFAKLLCEFSPEDLRAWCTELGVETFVGSSGRVFPTQMKAGELLLKWIEKLKTNKNFNLFLKHSFLSLSSEKVLTFDYEGEKVTQKANLIIFALGGASWKKTGSNGQWKEAIESLGIKVKNFKPMNCGFECHWSDFFKENVDRSSLKHVSISFQNKSIKGDLMVTPYGVEGGVIYALSKSIREHLAINKKATLYLDLRPTHSHDQLVKKLTNKPRKISLSNHLRKSLNFDKKMNILLKERLEDSDFKSMDKLSHALKSIPLEVVSARPLDEAISTSGGVSFSSLTDSLESKKVKGLYFAGEMLDYDAPTGGYLLQASFSTAFRVAKSISMDC